MIKGVKTEKKLNHKAIDKLYKQGALYAKHGEYTRMTHDIDVCKVPMNAEFTCPNWDGRLSSEGCVFCPNFARQFTYESFRDVIGASIKEQVKDQVEYYRNKGAGQKFWVYIAFGTNTYAPVPDLKKIFDETLDHPDVIGLAIGTRPDCLPDEVLDLLGSYVKQGYEIWLEVGSQTMHYHTSERVNRQHGVAESMRVVQEAHKRGIFVTFFLIMGMPNETRNEMIETARIISALGVDALKIYPCLVMQDTRLLQQYKSGKYRPLSKTEYVQLMADFIEHLSPYVLVQRISKDCGLEGKVVPEWNTHRFVIGPEVEKILAIRGTRQGAKYKLGLTAEELTPLEMMDKKESIKKIHRPKDKTKANCPEKQDLF